MMSCLHMCQVEAYAKFTSQNCDHMPYDGARVTRRNDPLFFKIDSIYVLKPFM